ncbi:MAG: hypothetical protein COA36_12790 [Desulfotalea sp.]|nr:MAG: hypothetical protein COA36_12790 [Desulfotalea sp.]
MVDVKFIKTAPTESKNNLLDKAYEKIHFYFQDFITEVSVLNDTVALLKALENYPKCNAEPVIRSRLSIILNHHLWENWYYDGIPVSVRVAYWAAIETGLLRLPEQYFTQWKDFVMFLQTSKARAIALRYSDMAGGWLFPGESHVLWEIARLACKVPGDFCELGAWSGRSATILCAAAKHFSTNKRVLLVDNWEWGVEADTYPFMHEGRNVRLELEQQLRPYSEMYQIFSGLILEKRDDVMANLQGKGLSLLHHDASHEFDQVHQDLEAYLPLLSDEGYLVVHDYNHPENLGVKKAVDTIVQNAIPPLHRMSVFNTIGLFRKGLPRGEADSLSSLGVDRNFPSTNTL